MAPVKLVPVMVTVLPVPADAGVKEVMAGAGIMSPYRANMKGEEKFGAGSEAE